MKTIDDPQVIAGYLTDASNVPGHAEALVRPESAEELAQVLAHCTAKGIGVTITAARTSTTAAAVPEGGWLVSTERLDRIAHIGHETAVASAGVRLGELQAAIEATGRMFPPDPTSRHDCTLGGAIACNASGARSFRYGPTRPWIEALQVVLADGRILEVHRDDPIPEDWPVPRWTEPQVKTAAGYPPPTSLVDLFIGQEGTLGVVTRATLRLTDRPDEIMGIVAFFPDRPTATTFMRHARAAARQDRSGPLSPICIEYLDRHCVRLAADRGVTVPAGAGCALFCEQIIESAHGEDGHLEAWWTALETLGALVDDTIATTNRAGSKALHELRHAVPAGINERVVRNGMRKVGTDLAVPDDALDAMMDLYEAAPVESVLFGHLGDNHLHLNLLPKTPDELALAKAFYDTLARRAIQLGGTVSAEHGIGKLKREHLAWMVGPEVLAGFARLKSALDPAWILGRGNMLAVRDAPDGR
ncbi:MAG: D-lactate dehydrogenase (cytochrome) [Myxococcota bacterium]